MKRCKAFGALLGLWFCCVFVFAAQAGAAETGKEAVAAANVAPCKGLGPFKDVDELLYQFYINLDSDCLFKMPLVELEKIWGIEILSHERATVDEYAQLEASVMFAGKPYRTDRDAFYVGAWQNNGATVSFFIEITQAYWKKYGTLFPVEHWPKLLPPPLEISAHTTAVDVSCKGWGGDICINYWLNSDKSKMIEMQAFEEKYWTFLRFTRVWILSSVRARYRNEENN